MITKRLLSFFLISLIFFIFSSSVCFAGIVPCGTSANPQPCTLCHLIVGFQNLVKWGLKIVVIAAITGTVIAGLLYMISSGSETMITTSKNCFKASLVGFAITVAAWLVVNTVLYWLLPAKNDLGVGVTGWNSFSCDTNSTATQGATTTPAGVGGTSPAITGAGGTCAGIPTQSGIARQCGDASSQLNNLLSCVQGRLGNAVTVSSISDGNGGIDCYRNNPTWSQCTQAVQSNCCYHARNSLHYTEGGSRAVDLVGSGASSGDISNAVKNCGGAALEEGTHIHGSI